LVSAWKTRLVGSPEQRTADGHHDTPWGLGVELLTSGTCSHLTWSIEVARAVKRVGQMPTRLRAMGSWTPALALASAGLGVGSIDGELDGDAEGVKPGQGSHIVSGGHGMSAAPTSAVPAIAAGGPHTSEWTRIATSARALDR